MKNINDVTKYVGYLGLHYGGKDSMARKLDEAVKTLNTSVLESKCCYGPQPKPTNKYCREVGMCICTPEGKQVHAFRTALHNIATKPVSKAHTEGREQLKAGKWCLHLRAKIDVAVAAAEVSDDEGPEIVESYLHIAYHVLSPWKSCWHLLELAAAPPGEPAANDERIDLRVYSGKRLRKSE